MSCCLSICLVEIWGFNTAAPKTTNEFVTFGPDFCRIIFKLPCCALSVSFLVVFLHERCLLEYLLAYSLSAVL